MKDLEKILLYVLKGGLILALASPLVSNNDFFFPFVVPRTAFFQIITGILLAAVIVLVVFFPIYRPKWTMLGYAISAFFVAGAFSTIFAIDPSKSFMGTVERAFGFFNILHYGILFLAASVALRSKKDWMIVLAASICVSLYAAVCFLLESAGEAKAQSVAGNPTFLAAHMMLNLFFAINLLKESKRTLLDAGLAFSAAILMVGVLVSNVRGAFVGVAAGILYLLIYTAIKSPKWRLKIIVTMVILVGGYFAIFVNRNTDFVRNNYTLQHVTSFSLTDGTIKSRFEMWKMALSGFAQRPILGWGRENFSYVFDSRYKNSDFESAGVGEQWEDRAHNIFFDEATNGGIVELLAYIALLVAAFITMRKHPVLLAALISYVVQNLFGVDTLNSFLPFFILLSFADFLRQEPAEISPEHHIPAKLPQSYAVSVSGICLVLFASIYFTVMPAIANTNIFGAAKAMMRNQYEIFESSYKNGMDILKRFPALKREYLTLIGSTLTENALPLVQANAYLKYANAISADIEIMYKAGALEQKNMLLFTQLLLQRGVAAQNINLIDQADEVLRRLITLTPNKKIFKVIAERSKSLRENAFSNAPVLPK